jgi:Zn-dependent M16 (insulinase) family peptidase
MARNSLAQLCLLIDGAVPLPELFDILNNKVDPSILAKLPPNATVPPQGWKRPFVETSTAKPLTIPTSKTEIVEFMEEDESIGDITMTFLGPPPVDYRSNLAIKLLSNYLTDSATAPLQKTFVEIPKPLCTGVGIYSEDRVNKNELQATLYDVPFKHLETLPVEVREKLAKIVNEEGIDMERMGLVIRRDKRKLLNSMESNVSGILADAVIGDFLYGDINGKDLPITFDDLEDYAVLEKWTAKDWSDLLDK